MRAKYIGDEDAPGSKSTILFGARRKIGEPFDVPPEQEAKARYNKFVEIVQESPPQQAATQQSGGPSSGSQHHGGKKSTAA